MPIARSEVAPLDGKFYPSNDQSASKSAAAVHHPGRVESLTFRPKRRLAIRRAVVRGNHNFYHGSAQLSDSPAVGLATDRHFLAEGVGPRTFVSQVCFGCQSPAITSGLKRRMSFNLVGSKGINRGICRQPKFLAQKAASDVAFGYNIRPIMDERRL